MAKWQKGIGKPKLVEMTENLMKLLVEAQKKKMEEELEKIKKLVELEKMKHDS